MKPIVLTLVVVSVVSCAERPAPQVVAPATGPVWRSLFNGQDLSGWRPVGSAVWRVDHKEGWPDLIVGTQDGDPKRAGNLVSVDQFQNFELELEFMIDDHGKYNSGVYLRNPPAGGKNGYQVNIGRGAAGEYCGGIVITDAPGVAPGTPTWLAKGDEADAIRKPLEWNSLRVL